MINKKNFYLNLSFILLFSAVLILFILRFLGTFSFTSPMHVITGGAEDSGLIAVWLIKNGKYGFDHYKEFYNFGINQPELHSAFHYNWLLYYSRSFFVTFFQKLFLLNDFWIPTIIRFQTLLLSLLSFFTFYLILNEIYKLKKIKIFLLSFIAIFGPVTGFWAISAKPDFNYLFFELLAFYICIKYLDKLDLKFLITLSFLFFLSFSSKQTSIVLLLSTCFYLFFKKDFTKMFIIISTFALLNFFTFFFLGIDAFKNIFFHGGHGINLKFSHFLLIFFDFVSKSLHIFLPFITFCILQKKTIFDLKKNRSKFLFIVVLFSILPILPSFHIGASVNYYFMFYFATFVYLFNLISKKNFKIDALESKIFSLFNTIQACLILLVIIGVKGNTKPVEYKNVEEFAKCIRDKDVKGKTFFDNLTYYRLPWIANPSNQNPLIITMVYEISTNHIEHQTKPIYKIIQNGEFDFVIIKGDQKIAKKKYDLKKYVFKGICNSNQKVSVFKNIN
ncbi:MAG: hypothetical protein ACJZ4U_02510 [Candidatus Pelagibacter sp.]